MLGKLVIVVCLVGASLFGNALRAQEVPVAPVLPANEPKVVLQAAGGPCQSHWDCADELVCAQGKCEGIVNQKYKVTIVSATVSEKTRDGDSWDCDDLPDVYVVVYYPDKQELLKTEEADDTRGPSWNRSFEVTVESPRHAMWFCFFDGDLIGSDDVRVGSKNDTNCVGYKSIVDFVRLGKSDFTTQGELKSFSATIEKVE